MKKSIIGYLTVFCVGFFTVAGSSTEANANYDQGLQNQLDREQNEAERKSAVQQHAEYERKLRLAKRRLVRWQRRLKRYRRELERLNDRQQELAEASLENFESGNSVDGISSQTELRLSRERIEIDFERRENRRKIAALKARVFWAEGWENSTKTYVKLYTDLEEVAEQRVRRTQSR